MSEKIKCLICGEQTPYAKNSFANNHLKKFHNNMTGKEYYDICLKKEGEGKCFHCNKDTRYVNMLVGYKLFCSPRCSIDSGYSREQYKKTCLEKYGTENYLASDEGKKKLKETMIERYGVTTPMKCDHIKKKAQETCKERYGSHTPFGAKEFNTKSKKTKLERYGDEFYNNPEKNKETCLEKYGVDSHFKVPEIRNKIISTCQERYGSDFPLLSEEVHQKTINTMQERYGISHGLNSKEIHQKTCDARNVVKKLFEEIGYTFDRTEDDGRYYGSCPKNHNFSIFRSQIFQRHEHGLEICTECNPVGELASFVEKEMADFISSYITIERNFREGYAKPELDVYIPTLNLAFEFNGLYWHSDVFKSPTFHLDKTEYCESKGIHLVHIFEDQWKYKKEIVKSRILNLLNLTPNKIFSRKCEIREVQSKDAKKFLQENHIQGSIGSEIALGLYHEDELVSLMTFGKLRKNLGQKHEEGSFELSRFCNKINTNVVGSASRLFKHFINNYKYTKIISYADRCWTSKTTKSLYDTLGFESLGTSKPNYYYVLTDIRENRFTYRKSVLVSEGFDPSLSEREIMAQRGFLRIFDCGTLKFIYQ